MGEKRIIFFMFIAYLHIAASKDIRANASTSLDPTPYSGSQKIEVTIHNNVDSVLELEYATAHWGSWVSSPSSIGAYNHGYYSNKGSLFAGPENDVSYRYRDYANYGTFQIYTNIDHFSGDYKYRLYYSSEFRNYFDIIERKVSRYHLEITLKKKN